MKEKTDFREHLYTINKRGERLWVYPSIVEGFYRNKRVVIAWILLLLYISAPWLTIGGEQAVLLDVASRKFTLFGTTFWASDTKFLALVLASLAFSLFFFSAILGRIWCGWACPETVFLEFVFRPIETLIEGGPAERRRLDAAQWNVKKIIKKGTKLLIFSAISWLLSNTALAYFLGREPLLEMMRHNPIQNIEMFLVSVALMSALLFQFGWFREQFCTVLCPYARFQSVLLDADSLVVGYDYERGEPRGKNGPGACIDCGLCVRVCPTGIDIRNGLQLECIHCTACADACDSIMKSLNREPGLVRYCTEHQLSGKKGNFLRPRVIVYSIVLILCVVLFIYSLASRETSEFQIIRASKGNAPFTELDGGIISNLLTLHLSNKDSNDQLYRVRVVYPEGIKIVTPVEELKVASGELGTLPIFSQFPKSLLQSGEVEVEFEVSSNLGFAETKRFTLIGPK